MANNPFKLNNPYDNEQENGPKKPRFSIFYYLAVILLLIGFQLAFFWSGSTQEIPYSEFRQLILANKVESVKIAPEKIYVELKKGADAPKQ
ncbi:MAG TPA: AAA family ATPase, partial [Chlorobaculum parvum]|nr:AAA family ATPase [Chlorobaculum parvum]